MSVGAVIGTTILQASVTPRTVPTWADLENARHIPLLVLCYRINESRESTFDGRREVSHCVVSVTLTLYLSREETPDGKPNQTWCHTHR
jgi:hypothetical protein